MAVSGNCLLDTNIVIALFAGEQSVLDHLKDANEVYIPSIVIGELYFGAHKSSQVIKKPETDWSSHFNLWRCDRVLLR